MKHKKIILGIICLLALILIGIIVVLLLNNFDKIIGCTSFKVYDSVSAEITTLFINSYDNRDKIAYKLIRQLEKIAIDYEFKNIRVSFDSKEDILVEIFEKLDAK